MDALVGVFFGDCETSVTAVKYSLCSPGDREDCVLEPEWDGCEPGEQHQSECLLARDDGVQGADVLGLVQEGRDVSRQHVLRHTVTLLR